MRHFSDSQIIHGDCIEAMNAAPAGCVDLLFADPPFNIGYVYADYDDAKRYGDYVKWTRDWMTAASRVLTETGSMYIAIGIEYAAEIRMFGRDLGLPLRNWIIWHYSFGQATKQMFVRSHVHILYFVKNAKHFTFNADQLRFPSARHTEYSDRRADPLGRLPNDVWDEFPRVAGTFKERQGWHGCQMPEALLMRIIRASSNDGEVVLDPFAGSGTTPAAAAKLGRIAVGIEMSKEYATEAQRRLAEAIEQRGAMLRANGDGWSAFEEECLKLLYRETATPVANLTPNAVAMECFAQCLEKRIGRRRMPDEITAALVRLDAINQLPKLKNDRPFREKRRRSGDFTGDRKLAQGWFRGISPALKEEAQGVTKGRRRQRTAR